MNQILERFKGFEDRILQRLKRNAVKHRNNSNSGLWVGLLVGINAVITLLRESGSYSEICLITGITGFGLIICCICLYLRLAMDKIVITDFQAIYFFPAIFTSVLYLYAANKGLITSMIWGLSVGTLGTWGVVQLMIAFPACFTIGEATAVTHAFTLFLMSVAANLPMRYHLPPIHDADIATIILQIGIIYIVAVSLLCAFFPLLRSTLYFCILLSISLICIVLPLLYIILDQNPLMWIIYFAFDSPQKGLLFVYWFVCLCLGVLFIAHQTLKNSQATTITRKSFHLLAVMVYIPGIIYEPTLLYLASGGVFALFAILEVTRLLNISPMGTILQEIFSIFVDEKDALVSLTPLYLLCGLSYALWMPTNSLPLVCLFSGILTVGIGDTTASYVGCNWGTHKWPSSEKSLEGTFACALSQIGLICALMYTGYITTNSWLFFRSLIAIIAISLVEARTNQIDNLVLPLLMYTCLAI